MKKWGLMWRVVLKYDNPQWHGFDFERPYQIENALQKKIWK
jgi:hypothetical protein